MSQHKIIRGAHVIDGSGLAGYTADVEVRDGTIERIGRIGASSAAEIIDADGLVLTPGFVDIHTHYEAQLFFEPTASPSSAHGVTTVITGNCGFTFAPAESDDFNWLIQMLAKVEGMSVDALTTGVSFGGGSFGDFLSALDGKVAVNLAAHVGHAAVRRSVMGDDASHRAASPTEIAAMAELVRQSMRDGAFGFSSSQLPVHADHVGNPVPPNLADHDELIALASVLAEFSEGVLQFAHATSGITYSDADRELLLAMARASGNKAMDLTILMSRADDTESWRRNLDFLEDAAAQGLRLYPMASVNGKGLHFTFADTFVFDEMTSMRTMMGLPMEAKKAHLRESSARDAFRADWADTTGRSLRYSWDTTRVASVANSANGALEGRTITDLAADGGIDPMDFIIDLALSEDLATVFAFDPMEQSHEVLAFLLNHPLTMAGSSDGGAHLNSFCGADYSTRMLTECVDRGDFSFETAVSQLTHVPAMAHGFWDRGSIRPGAAADLVLLERDKLAIKPIRFVNDLPAGASRLVWDQEGYVATIVAGEAIVENGQPTGALPGKVLRSNQTS